MPEVRTAIRVAALGGVLAGSAIALVPAAATAEPAPPAACEIHELPVPPGTTEGGVRGVSPDGRTAVGRAVGYGPTMTEVDVVWRDGEIVDTPADLPDALTDVNDEGVAVGGIFDEYGDRRPYVLRDGEVHVLPGHVTPRGINGAGEIAGYRTDEAGSVPVVWEPGSDRPVDLAGPRGIATDISADGTVVGTVGAISDGPTDGYVWRPDGTSAPLPRPAGVAPDAHLEATGISGPWVFGGGPDGAIRWNLDTGAAESVPDTVAGSGAINDRGVLAAPAGSGQDGVLVDGEQRTPLPGMNGWQLAPRAISQDGTVITGSAGMLKGPSTPVRWTCS